MMKIKLERMKKMMNKMNKLKKMRMIKEMKWMKMIEMKKMKKNVGGGREEAASCIKRIPHTIGGGKNNPQSR